MLGSEKDDDIDDEDIFEPFEIEWWEENGPDGQEIRLSQMLADEEWEDEDEEIPENKTMTYEEFATKASEIITQAKDEIRETKEIMSVSPGNEAEYDVEKKQKENKSSMPTTVMDEPEPAYYDQTKLDGISQLWGAPPEVLEFHTVEDDSEQTIINDGIDFRNVYTLFGQEVPGGISLDEELETSSPSSMDGFSQLWNEKLSPYNRDDESSDSSNMIDHSSSYAGFDWWDERTEDGKEFRLSQMLADEEYEEWMEEEDEAPMTFERFAEETVQLIEQAEDERRETEAIMSAPPNANYLEEEEDYEVATPEDLEEAFTDVASSEEFSDLITSLSEDNEDLELSDPDHWTSLFESSKSDEDGIVSDEDIDVLNLDEEESEVDNSLQVVKNADIVGDAQVSVKETEGNKTSSQVVETDTEEAEDDDDVDDESVSVFSFVDDDDDELAN